MKRVALTLAVLGSLVSCSALAEAPNGKPLIYVSNVVIEADMDRTSSEEVKYYTDAESEATTLVRNLFKGEGYVLSDSPSADGNQITVNTVAKFDAGNQAVRWVGGLFGAGKASAKVTMEAVDQSGNAIAKKQAENTMRMGGFGGNAKRFLMGVIDTAWNEVIADIPPAK